MDWQEVGEYLEHNGLSDEDIDAFLEHHGVKGQKWGLRRTRNQTVSAPSSNKQAIDKARADIASGKVNKDYEKATTAAYAKRKEIGIIATAKLMSQAQDRRTATIAKSKEVRDGKEAAIKILDALVSGLLSKPSG